MVTKAVTKVKKRPGSDEVKKLLLEGNFGLSTNDPLPLTDPISTTQMVLQLNDIKPYDKNPRRERNPAYEEIKASIRSKKQLNNNFNVTRRPGDDLFMVESGGNTRLSILKELYQETADEAFNTVHCLFVPWKSESSILTAHLIENEMRGDMMLIDKAYAVQELKRELEGEKGTKISVREFTRLAENIGYKISARHISRFNYAIELDQMIPLVMRTGIGGNKIDHIKKVEKAYQQYCLEKTNTEKEQFDAAFMAVMSESNTDECWDFDQTRLELDDRLSELTGVRYNLLRLEVDAILFNQPINAADQFERNDLQQSEIEQQIESTPIPLQTQANASEIKQQEHDVLKSNAADDGVSDTNNQNTVSAVVSDTDTIHLESEEKETGIELKILHQKGFELACKIARSANIEDSGMPAKCGLGFFMESPGQPLAAESVSYYHWWLLFGISEQNVNNETHYPMWAYTDLYSRFGEDQRNQDNSLVNWVGHAPVVAQLMYEFIHQQQLMSDQVFTNVFRLMENCRKIRSHFLENTIWEEPS